MADIIIRSIVFLSILGIILRPFKLPEAVWAMSGALLLVLVRLLTLSEALSGMLKGMDVYLFLPV